MPEKCQAVFDAYADVDFIEGVPATTLPAFGGDAIGGLRTVVGQQFDDPGRRGQLEPAQRSTLFFSAMTPKMCINTHA